MEVNPYTARAMISLPLIEKEKQIKKNIMMQHESFSKKGTPVDTVKYNSTKHESSRVYRQQYMNMPQKPHEIVNKMVQNMINLGGGGKTTYGKTRKL